MTLKEAFELVAHILVTMETGEIILFVKNCEIKHVNRKEEVFLTRNGPAKF